MQEIEEFIQSLIPCRIEAIWGTITGSVGALATFLFGGWNDALTALAMFILIDYVTGVMAAYLKPRAKLSSKKGLKGIVKKLALITFVVFAHYLDMAIGQNIFCTVVTYSIMGNEGLSVVENLAYCGVPIPVAIKGKLEQLANEKEGVR
jgi:toxin secretion/phage lysis holin